MGLSDQFNKCLDDLGEFGPYQRRAFLLLAISTLPTGWHAYSQVLLSYEPDFACKTPSDNFEFNSTFPEYHKLVVPVNDTEIIGDPQCYTYDFGDTNYTSPENVMQFTNGMDGSKCEAQEWIFDDSDFKSTATTEWGNVCDRKQLNTFDTQSFMIGKLIGAFIFGAMSDALGRFKTYFIALVLQLICGVIIAVAPNMIIYSLARLAIGATCSGVYLCAYVLALEFIGPQKRTTPGLVYHMFYAIGYSLLAPIGYFVKDFRTISWMLAIPSLLFMPYYFFMDESVQWLLGKKRVSEAEAIVVKAATYNNKTLATPIFTDDDETTATPKKGQLEAFISMFVDIWHVMKGNYPKLRTRFLALFALWFINSGSYYGLTLNTKNLGGNFYMNFVLGALIELPAIGLIIFMVEKWDIGRRQILMGTYFLCGFINLIVATLQGIPDDSSVDPWKTLIIVFAMCGKFAIAGAYAVIYLFSTEQFPTVIKNSGLGVCSFCARIGGLLCPYVIMTNDLWKPLPLLIFGVVAVVAGCLMFFLPETHKKHLPTTLEEGERFGTEDADDGELEKLGTTLK